VATPATLATADCEPQNSAIAAALQPVATTGSAPATLATGSGRVAAVAISTSGLATPGKAQESAQNQRSGDGVADVATVASEIPSDWRCGVASMSIGSCPDTIPADRWTLLLRAADRFLASPWSVRLAELGWRTPDIFGADHVAPIERHDHKGLIWFLPGCRLIVVTAATATVETPTGSRQTYYRAANRITEMVALWELADGKPRNADPAEHGADNQNCPSATFGEAR
jgi:hypothetical protein